MKLRWDFGGGVGWEHSDVWYRMCGVDCFPVAVTYETQVGGGGGAF